MSSQEAAPSSSYRDHLFDRLPLYSTRLVRETEFTYSNRLEVSDQDGLANFPQDYYKDKDREEFITALFDNADTISGLSRISVGGLSSAIVKPRQVFKPAILTNAAGIVLAHNHVSKIPEPSEANMKITSQLVEAGEIMEIPVHDHLIIAQEDYTSLREHGCD